MALNTPYKRVDLNVNPNYASMAQKDPWFALGYALGEGYWNNYNERGIKKGTEKAMDELAKHTGVPQSSPAPQDIIDQAMTLSVGGNTVSADSVKKAGEKGKEGGVTTVRPELDHPMLKWGYTLDKYKDNPNPVSDGISVKNVVKDAEKTLLNANMGVFDDAKFYTNLRKELILDGRNSRQIDAIMANIKPVVDEKKAEYNNQVSNQLYDLYKQAQSLGDTASADSFLMQIQKINPNMGKFLAEGRVTERDRFKAQEARELARIKASGRGGRGGSKGNTNNDEMNYLTSEIKILQDRKDGGSELSETEENRLKYLKERKYRLEQEKFGVQNQPEKVNYKNPAQLIADGKANIKDGKATNAEIRNLLNDMLKDGRINQSVFDEVIKEFTDKPATLKARRHDEDSKLYMFNGRDVSKRSGIALSAEDFELIEYLGGTRDRVFPKEKKT